jgi:hypothetical protein
MKRILIITLLTLATSSLALGHTENKQMGYPNTEERQEAQVDVLRIAQAQPREPGCGRVTVTQVPDTNPPFRWKITYNNCSSATAARQADVPFWDDGPCIGIAPRSTGAWEVEAPTPKNKPRGVKPCKNPE